MTFGEKLKSVRKEAGLSQEQLPKKVEGKKFDIGNHRYIKGYRIL